MTPAVTRPLPMRMLPARLRLSLWARYYRGRAAGLTGLYAGAPLDFAPSIRMNLVPGDVISDSIAMTGIYELGLTRRVHTLASRGGLMVEVGANLGYFTLLWASASSRNRVVAVEAAPRNLDLLRENVISNRLQDRIQVLGVAAGNHRGRMTFDPGPADQTGWGGFAPASASGGIEVDVVRLDDVLTGDDEITLLKIDAEGADSWVLEGCSRLLGARAVREVWFEQNKPRMRALGIADERPVAYLRERGYLAVPDDAGGDVVSWRAIPQP